MDFKTIMQDIIGGLTGNKETDIPYLEAQSEKYRGSEFETEINREIGRLIFKLASKEKQDEFSETLQNDIENSYMAKFKKTRELSQAGKYEEALAIIEPLMKGIPESVCKDDTVNEYRHFSEIFEKVLYLEQCKPSRTLRPPFLPLSEGWSLYGNVLIDLNRPFDARKALETAMHWEPRNATIAFEHAETYKMQKNMGKFLECTKEVYKFSYTKRHLARCYRNFGYYFSELKKWDVATACIIMSIQYEKNSEFVRSELIYIQQQSGKELEDLSLDSVVKLLKDNDIPIGVNEEIPSIAYQYGKLFFDRKEMASAKYFLDIAYKLTEHPEIKKMLDIAKESAPVQLEDFFNIPEGFSPVDSRPTDPDGCRSYVLQNSNTLALLQIYPIEQKDVMPFNNPQQIIDGIRGSLAENQALIEVNNKIVDSKNGLVYSIIKTLHEEQGTGVQYFMLAHMLIKGYLCAVRGFFDEIGMTGERDTVVFSLLHKNGEIKSDDNKIPGWFRDPYDPSLTGKFFMNISEESRFDGIFPKHPLSICRNVVESLKANISVSTETKAKESAPVKESTSDTVMKKQNTNCQKQFPQKPAERPKGKTVITCGVECVLTSRKDPVLVQSVLYSDGRLYKAYYVESQESIVNGMRKPVLYELIGTSPEAAEEMKSTMKECHEEYSSWPDKIDAYGDGKSHSYYYTLKVPSKSFYGEDMFSVQPYGPKVKALYDIVAGIIHKYFPETDLMESFN